ncbi:MAG: peptide deformylase [Candidatus Hodgkinia cicadicola]
MLNSCGVNSAQVGQPIGLFVARAAGLGWRAHTIVAALMHRALLMGASLATHEGCLSIRRFLKRVQRRVWILLIYSDVLNARIRAFKTSELLAKCYQHEIDHSNGTLIIDY